MALNLECESCAALQNPDTNLPGRLRPERNFNETIGVDLFSLADQHGRTLNFLNVVCHASTYQVCTPVDSRHPAHVFSRLMETWLIPFGIPSKVVCDQGGEFEREFAKELEDLGSKVSHTPGNAPTQNSIAERHGGMWKHHAMRLIHQYQISFIQPPRVLWLCSALNWAVNSAVNESGYSPGQWVLGKGIKLPYSLLDSAGRLSLHERVNADPQFSERVALMSAAQRSVTALRYSRTLSRAILARSRIHGAEPARSQYQIGDQVFYFRATKVKRQWSTQWHGPASIIGFENNNVWLAHRNSTVKCAVRSLRPAQPSEMLPWSNLLRTRSSARSRYDPRRSKSRPGCARSHSPNCWPPAR